MKNIILGSVFMLVFLPQLSFGAVPTPVTANDPQTEAFIQKQNAEATAFFQQQDQERRAFMQANPDIIRKQDEAGRRALEQQRAQKRQDMLTGSRSAPIPLPGITDSTLMALTQKQLNDKQAFLAKLAQEKQSFLNSQSASNPA